MALLLSYVTSESYFLSSLTHEAHRVWEWTGQLDESDDCVPWPISSHQKKKHWTTDQPQIVNLLYFQSNAPHTEIRPWRDNPPHGRCFAPQIDVGGAAGACPAVWLLARG